MTAMRSTSQSQGMSSLEKIMRRVDLPATIAGHLDHRICMSFAIAGLVSKAPVEIDDMAPVATSFPNFEALLGGLQA